MSSGLHLLKRSWCLQLLFGITFILSGIIVNIVQCILYLTLRPINKFIYRKINWYLCATIYSHLLFMGEWWGNVNLTLYIDKDDFDKYWGKEHAFCVMNHTYEIDWLVGWMICDRIHLLGNAKAYMKKVLQYMPVLGWAWKFSEFIVLERSFEKDKDVIHKQVKELVEHPDPIWLLLYPEGTRFTEAKHKVSEEFAKCRNLPPLKHFLQPRTRGFTTALPSMRKNAPAVYDILVEFKDEGIQPTMKSLMMGESLQAVMYMKRIPMEEVPHTLEEQDSFLRNLFVIKDKMKESFIETGDLFETSGVERVKPFQLPRRMNSLINSVVWAILLVGPMTYYLVGLLLSGNLMYVLIACSCIVFTFMLSLYKMVGLSEISKGSSYGTLETTPKNPNND